MTLETLYLNEGIKVSIEAKWTGFSTCLVRRAVWWNGETQTVFEKPYDDSMTNEEFVHTAVSRYAASILQEVNDERGVD